MIRKSTPDDIDLILRMYDHSRSVMRADGNMAQWVGYPTREDIEEDIRRGVSYIIEASPQPLSQGEGPCQQQAASASPLPGRGARGEATFALVPGVEPTYAYIDHGRWVTPDRPYSTLHRLAAMPGAHGIADIVFRHIKGLCDYLRVDTHLSNRPMHHILEKEGFVFSGIIYMPDGSPRDAYEWWRYDDIPADLKAYVESDILPRHEHYDAAHRPDHIRRVIARSMAMRPHPLPLSQGEGPCQQQSASASPLLGRGVRGEAVYAAAAMHDIGICEGREVHHLASGRIIRADRNLRRWFSEEEVELIAQAAEDHRASATTPPRSPLGMIIAEADRDIEPETIVRRTIEYGLSHYPELDREGHWQRTLDHLHEKYAEGGYIRLWMGDASPNAAPLADLRALIHDEPRLRRLFDQLIEQLKIEN